MHGGNGYIEQWPVARLLRDAQVNTLWEGPDNILCLDVRRGIERERADVPFLDRLRDAAGGAPAGDAADDRRSCGERIEDLATAIERWQAARPARPARPGCSPSPSSWSTCTPARCSLEQAGFEQRELGSDRKPLVARLYARHLADRGPLRGVDDPAEELPRFKDLYDGALVDTP